MNIPSINKAIAAFNASYGELNQSWLTDFCEIDELQLSKQKDYYDFLNLYKDFNFEELVISVISLKIDPAVLNGIRNQLKNNIRLYRKNKTKFGAFDTYRLFEYSEQQLFDNKLEVFYKYKADIEADEYSTPGEKQKLLKEVEEAIKKLKSDKSGYIHSGEWVRKNYYKEIFALTTKFLSILDSYFPVAAKENSKVSARPLQMLPKAKSLKKEAFINMRLASDIYELCNNKQFEPLSETDFYQLLNNLPSKATLAIKPGEKNRIYFLIHKILETLPDADKKEWRDYIFKKLDISEAQYRSKYREPISQMPTKPSKEFAKNLREIFNNH